MESLVEIKQLKERVAKLEAKIDSLVDITGILKHNIASLRQYHSFSCEFVDSIEARIATLETYDVMHDNMPSPPL